MDRTKILIRGLIKNLQKHIKLTISKKIKSKQISYHISGKVIENFVADEIVNFFSKLKDVKLEEAYRPKGKNEFPDVKIRIALPSMKYKLFFEVKVADSSKDPENDLGTLRSLWKQHIQKDIGLINLDYLFIVFVKYSKTDGKINKIDKVYIAHYFKFVGTRNVSSIKILKYRKKDGNLRPKSWADIDRIKYPYLTKKELKSFIVKYYLTIIFRSLSIIKEHQKILKKFQNFKNTLKDFEIEKLDLDENDLSKDIEKGLKQLLKKSTITT